MSRSIVVVDEQLMRISCLPKTGRQILRNQLSYDLQFTSPPSIDSQDPSRTVQVAIALRREVTVSDFMKPNIEIIELPAGISLVSF